MSLVLYARSLGARNGAPLLALLAACTARPPPASAPPEAQVASRQLVPRGVAEPLAVDAHSVTAPALRAHLFDPARAPARGRPRAAARESLVRGLLNPVTGARFVRDRGAALANALAALPPERRAYGVSAFTLAQLDGAGLQGGLCEDPMVDLELTHRGQTYEARYRTQSTVWSTPPQPSLYALSSTCTAALAASAGAIARAVGAGCGAEDEAAHFPAGSRCRACLEIDGDHARCVAASACRVERNRELAVNGTFYDVLEADALACAPDRLTPIVILAGELGEADAAPDPFDHTALEKWCRYVWDPAARAPALSCISNGRAHLAYADVVAGWAEYIRRPGTTGRTYSDRLWLAPRVEVDGYTFEATPLYPGALAEVSTMDRRAGGWGVNPRELRPDGRDPAVRDDTYARDWVGAVSLKTATNIDGVLVSTFNRNLCATDDWQGPDARGRSFCRVPFYDTEHPPAEAERWSYDWGVFNLSLRPPIVDVGPAVTLAATGLPDPRIPGGHILQVLGSPILADPDWEDCAWPDQFQPDEMANADSVDVKYYTFTGQTYRFGKDPRFDVRIALTTNHRRAFCWEALPDL